MMPLLEYMLLQLSHTKSQCGPAGSGTSKGGPRSAMVMRRSGRPGTRNGSVGELTSACGLCVMTAPQTYEEKPPMPRVTSRGMPSSSAMSLAHTMNPSWTSRSGLGSTTARASANAGPSAAIAETKSTRCVVDGSSSVHCGASSEGNGSSMTAAPAPAPASPARMKGALRGVVKKVTAEARRRPSRRRARWSSGMAWPFAMKGSMAT
uniref:Uncharacterized protein n=1 Tax=Triticum urartu TaxID=4572 RepID=A0A8R7R3D6_TRIUA